MPDLFDAVQERELLNLEQALQAQKEVASATLRPAPQGYCLNPMCADEFEPGSLRLFCGPKCAEEHAKYSRLK